MSYWRARYVQSVLISGQNIAQGRIGWAVQSGKLPKASTHRCIDCGKSAQVYDHRDYNRPLDVDPVCRSCNWHRGPAAPKQWTDDSLLQYLSANARLFRVGTYRFCRWTANRLDAHLAAIETATKGRFKRHQLRPDLYQQLSR